MDGERCSIGVCKLCHGSPFFKLDVGQGCEGGLKWVARGRKHVREMAVRDTIGSVCEGHVVGLDPKFMRQVRKESDNLEFKARRGLHNSVQKQARRCPGMLLTCKSVVK